MKASILLSVPLLALGAPALADTVSQERFEHNGITYVYETEERGDQRILTGRHYPTGARFRLVVRDGRVTGRMNGTTVNFRLSEIDEARAEEIRLASR
ncbi:hypothetical protein HFP57_13510 [Parasphingopyxis algicola]|uniref:hypothetical protein n=1 Tax=Parasphingopyxis algicola TaxID=2026624 RepID=UPI0015A4B020|nr:hypothetical protein [Parasphingopyxis algicola]QLC25942.1 hypothetical protein HFP57_13510 [Parasphingopyxis algicola]